MKSNLSWIPLGLLMVATSLLLCVVGTRVFQTAETNQSIKDYFPLAGGTATLIVGGIAAIGIRIAYMQWNAAIANRKSPMQLELYKQQVAIINKLYLLLRELQTADALIGDNPRMLDSHFQGAAGKVRDYLDKRVMLLPTSIFRSAYVLIEVFNNGEAGSYYRGEDNPNSQLDDFVNTCRDFLRIEELSQDFLAIVASNRSKIKKLAST